MDFESSFFSKCPHIIIRQSQTLSSVVSSLRNSVLEHPRLERLERHLIDSIYITNFRRIREADIKLRDGVTVLTGDNGTGKSTIIEAIIFNLYGKTKSGAKKETIRRFNAADDEETFTVIDFTIGDLHYRCRRWLTKKMSVIASLYSYTEDEYAKLLEDTKDDRTGVDKSLGTMIATSTSGVTNAITETLGVSYDAFCASFIAQQKELDSLASLTPENRKKFFLDILGYSRLDSIKPDINKEVRSRQGAVDIMQRQSIDTDAVSKQIDELSKQIDETNARVAKGKVYVDDAQKKADELTQRYDALVKVSTQVKQAGELIMRQTASLEKHEQQIAALDAAIDKNRKIAADYDENVSITEQLVTKRSELEAARSFEQAQRELEQMRGNENASQAIIDDLMEQIAALEKRTATEPDSEAADKALRDVTSRLAVNRSSITSANVSIKSLSGLLADVRNGSTAKCPTCGSDVSTAEGLAHLEGELASAQEQLASLENEQQQLTEEQQACQQRSMLIKNTLRTYNRDLQDLSGLRNRLEGQQKSADDTRRQIEQSARDLAASKGTQRTTEQIMALEMEVAELAARQSQEQKMKSAYYAVKRDEERRSDLQATADDERKAIAEQQAFVKEHENVAAEFDAVAQERAENDVRLKKYRTALEGLRHDQGSQEAAIKSAKERLEEGYKQKRDLADLLSEIEVYNGAKAVIEFLREKLPTQIAPRLSERASKLLDVATGGTYNLLEINENYEVFVYTETTIQPIALMSGGEQDVISLCIRIAIAEMILEATGIEHQTFILDEIFGALDDDRKATTCEALQNLGQSLSKILCITHVEEIKDMADWTYVVEKDENGVSSVREVEKKTL